jgi:EpsI family protein
MPMPRKLSDRRFLLASVLLLGQIVGYYSLSGKETIVDVSPWSQFPAEIGKWHAVNAVPIDPDALAALKPDDYLDRDYVSKDQNGALNFVVVYFSTRRHGQAPHSPQWCLPGAGWRDVSSRVVTEFAAQGGPPEMMEYIIRKGLDRQLVVYWYHQGTRISTNEVTAQFYALPEMLLHGRTDTALVRIITPIAGEDTDAARNRAFGFARDVFHAVRTHLK